MICVDASVAAKWIFLEDFSEQAIALAADCAAAGEPIFGPVLLPLEITNTIRRRMLRDRLGLAEARVLLDLFSAFSVTIAELGGLSEQALALADSYGLPAVYDAYYIALAQLLGCDYWTNDRRLLHALGGKLPFVKWIGDYPLA